MYTCSALGSVIVQTPVFPEECLAQAWELSLFLQVPSTVAKMQRLGHQINILMWEINNKKKTTFWLPNSFLIQRKHKGKLSICVKEHTNTEGTHNHERTGVLPPTPTGLEVKFLSHFWPVQLLCLHCAAHPCDWSFKGSHWGEGGAEALSLPSHKPMPECFSSSASQTGPPSKQKCQTIWYLRAGWLPFPLGREGSMQ